MSQYALKNCDNCKKEIRRAWRYKNKMLCYNCYMKSVKLVFRSVYKGKTLKQTLEKVYECKEFINAKGYSQATPITFPKILIGKKFKIQIIEDE